MALEALSVRAALSVVACGLLVVLASCSAPESDTSTTTPGAGAFTTIQRPTTTTIPPDLAGNLVDALDQVVSSSVIQFGGRLAIGDIEVVVGGTGSLHRDDSAEWVVSDFSSLDRAFVDESGRVLGRGAAQITSQANAVVDDIYYRQIDGGIWRVVPDESTTVVRHIFRELAAVPAFDVIGPDSASADGLWLLRPDGEVTYDSVVLGIDVEGIDAFHTDTTIVVDATGAPTGVEISATGEGSNDVSVRWEFTFEIVGEADPVVAPIAEIPISSLGFGVDTASGPMLGFVDMDVPSTWQLASQDDGLLQFNTPEGVFVTILGEAALGVSVDGVMSGLLDAVGIDAAVEEAGIGIFPDRIARHQGDETGFSLAYVQAQLDHAAIAVFWSAVPSQLEIQEIAFRDLIATIRWGNGTDENLVLGDTLADPTLQQDVLDILLIVAAAAADSCDSPYVVWTEVVSGSVDEWGENWFVDACGDVQVHDVEFTPTSDGGTDIGLSHQPQVVGEDWDHASGDPLSDARDMAEVLRVRPWFVEPSLSVDEAAIALPVAIVRGGGGRLYAIISDRDFEPEYVEELKSHIGFGIVLYVTPDGIGYTSFASSYSPTRIEQAFQFAADGTSPEEQMERFMIALIGGE